MASIILRTIGGIDDNRLSIGNEQAARLRQIGTNWTTIRLGLRLSVNGSASISGTPRFALGLCSGTTMLLGSASTKHFVGVRSAVGTWTRTTGPPAYYSVAGSPSIRAIKRVGTTLTTGNEIAPCYISSAPASVRSVFLLNIVKGSPNYSLQCGMATTSAAGQTDVSLAQFEQMLALESISGISAIVTGYGTATGTTIAVNEANDGLLDAMQILWDRSSPEIEVSDIGYARIA